MKNDLPHRTAAATRILPELHTMHTMRLHGKTKARWMSHDCSMHSVHTVLQGPHHTEHATASNHRMHHERKLEHWHQVGARKSVETH